MKKIIIQANKVSIADIGGLKKAKVSGEDLYMVLMNKEAIKAISFLIDHYYPIDVIINSKDIQKLLDGATKREDKKYSKKEIDSIKKKYRKIMNGDFRE